MANKFCPNCGAALTPDDRFCTTCGHPVETQPESSGPAQPVAPPTPEDSGAVVGSSPEAFETQPEEQEPTYAPPPPPPPPPSYQEPPQYQPAPPPPPPSYQEPPQYQPAPPPPPPPSYQEPPQYQPVPPPIAGPGAAPQKKRTGLWVALGCLGVLLLGCVIFVVIPLVKGASSLKSQLGEGFDFGNLQESIEAMATEAAEADIDIGQSLPDIDWDGPSDAESDDIPDFVDTEDLPALTDSDRTVLYSEDFSNSSSGWDYFSESAATLAYNNARYEITVHDSDLVVWGNANVDNFDDGYISVDTIQLGGPDDNAYGIVFRYVDQDNFYRFDISGDGYYRLGLYEDDVWTTLVGWNSTDLVNQGQAANKIGIRCEGDAITLYINGVELDTVFDGAHRYGDIGLGVETMSMSGASIAFDNLVVHSLQ